MLRFRGEGFRADLSASGSSPAGPLLAAVVARTERAVATQRAAPWTWQLGHKASTPLVHPDPFSPKRKHVFAELYLTASGLAMIALSS